MNQNRSDGNPNINPSTKDIDVVDDWSNSEYARSKRLDRMRLLAMSPVEAQELVNTTLFPQLWSMRMSDRSDIWCESIPKQDEDEDYPY